MQIGGSSLPAVRVELNPLALFKYGIGLEDVRAALASANAHSPKGAIEDGDRRLQIYTNDKANHAEDYRPLVIAYRDGAAVRLSDVAEVEDSVENVRAIGLAARARRALYVFWLHAAALLEPREIVGRQRSRTRQRRSLRSAGPPV